MRKFIFLILLSCNGWAALTSGPNGPTVGASVAGPGATAWSTPGNITAPDGAYTDVLFNGGTIFDDGVFLLKAGTIVGTDHSSGTGWSTSGTFAYVSYGSSLDLWGTTWVPSDINNANFGDVLASSNTCNGAQHISQYLQATGYGFSIPASATINGIFLEVLETSVGGGASFVAGTMVNTPRGRRKIEDLQVGDQVYGWDGTSQVTETVARAWSHTVSSYTYIGTDNNHVFTTPDHMFSTVNYGFQPAGLLHMGDFLWMSDSQGSVSAEPITSIENFTDTVAVYDIELSGEPHTFFVNNFLVHNPLSCLFQTDAEVDYERITVTYTPTGCTQMMGLICFLRDSVQSVVFGKASLANSQSRFATKYEMRSV